MTGCSSRWSGRPRAARPRPAIALAERARRRDRLGRLDARLPGDGHRHREADRRRSGPRVPHHLIDVAEPSERFTVARYQELARAALDEIDRGRCLRRGASGLYFRALVDGLVFPPEDAGGAADAGAEARGARGRRACTTGCAGPIRRPREDRARERAPDGAGARGRGAHRGAVQHASPTPWERYDPARVRAAGVRTDRAALAARIEARVHAMLDAGLARRGARARRARARVDGSPRRRRSATRSSRRTSTVGSRSTRPSERP